MRKQTWPPSKKEVLKAPWRKVGRLYDLVWLIPSGKIHDSGYMTVAVIGVWKENDETKYELCGMPDDIACHFPTADLGFEKHYPKVRMDCYYPSGILQYHGHGGKFRVGDAFSSQDIYFILS